MEPDIIIVFGIILGALILFLWGVFPVDQTAIFVMVSLMVSGVLTPEEGVSGFSNSATITILALLIISQGLKNTGVVDELGDQLLKITGKKLWTTMLMVMVVAAICSAFINTTAVVAVLIPIIFKISQEKKINPSFLLMPLSFAAMVGGSSSMIGTSTNLLINSTAVANGVEAFNIFDLSLFGGILLVALVLYMIFIGVLFLKKKTEKISVFDQEVESKIYLTELEVTSKSEYIGKKLSSLKLYDKTEYELLRINRNGKTIVPSRDPDIKEGDILLVKTDIHEVINLNNIKNLRITTSPKRQLSRLDEEDGRILFEVLIVPTSNLIGRKIGEVQFERSYDAYPLAIHQKGANRRSQLNDHKIEVGDILLMDSEKQPETEITKHDWIITQLISRDKIEKALLSREKMISSVAILAGVILLAVTGILPILISAWLGVVFMLITGSLSIKQAYDNVEWKVVFLLAGIIPLGTALSKTGGDELIAGIISDFTEGYSLRFVVSVLFLLTVLLTGIISNQATAVLLVPIAINIAHAMGMAPEPLLVAILFGANTSFLTPVGYQTNAMIYGPGNYNFMDFVKTGGLLSLVFWILATILIPEFYG